jgi:phosphoribosylformimino-5-aminoimidazole carboxamide ribotide isomerase
MVVPAIDLLDGQVVRLEQGRYDRVTVYDADPVERARAFVAAGASRLHLVDLTGARAGAPVQAGLVERIARAVPVPVQVGGGVRTSAHAQELVDAGAAAVVMGTSAVREPVLVQRTCALLPGRVIVAIDARDGRVAIEGWTETSAVEVETLAEEAAAWGAAALLYTDVHRDGMRVGPNLETTGRLAAVSSRPVYASGGVGRLEDLVALASLRPPLAGAIVGRALYAGAFTLEEAIASC